MLELWNRSRNVGAGECSVISVQQKMRCACCEEKCEPRRECDEHGREGGEEAPAGYHVPVIRVCKSKYDNYKLEE